LYEGKLLHLGDGVRDGNAVEGRGAAAELVHQHLGEAGAASAPASTAAHA
jgi:hypothetical protein